MSIYISNSDRWRWSKIGVFPIISRNLSTLSCLAFTSDGHPFFWSKKVAISRHFAMRHSQGSLHGCGHHGFTPTRPGTGGELRDSFSPPARWGLLDFIKVASCLPLLPSAPAFRSCLPLLPSASAFRFRLLPRPRPPRPTAIRDPHCSVPDLNHDHPCSVFPAGPQPRPSTPSVPCRTSTTTIHAQCSLPDLNHDHSRPVFPAGRQPRPSPPSVPCRTSTASIHAQCSLPDLM